MSRRIDIDPDQGGSVHFRPGLSKSRTSMRLAELSSSADVKTFCVENVEISGGDVVAAGQLLHTSASSSYHAPGSSGPDNSDGRREEVTPHVGPEVDGGEKEKTPRRRGEIMVEEEAGFRTSTSSSRPPSTSWRAFEEDVWTEEHLQYGQLFKTVFLESIPAPVGYFFCWLLENKASAHNRFVIDGDKVALLAAELTVSPTMWFVIFALWLADTEGNEEEKVHWTDIAVLALLKLYRFFGIALKYAYFTDSELACVRGTQKYGDKGVVYRRLGGAAFHDDIG
ncbi:unnamed protein product, partial [Amoebophrya sp. A120]|eukprot:GSA120T00008009001.1